MEELNDGLDLIFTEGDLWDLYDQAYKYNFRNKEANQAFKVKVVEEKAILRGMKYRDQTKKPCGWIKLRLDHPPRDGGQEWGSVVIYETKMYYGYVVVTNSPVSRYTTNNLHRDEEKGLFAPLYSLEDVAKMVKLRWLEHLDEMAELLSAK